MGSDYYGENTDSSHNSDTDSMDEAIGFGEGGNDAFGDVGMDLSFGSNRGEEITTHRNDDGEFVDVQMGSVEVNRKEDGRFAESDDNDDDGGFLSGFLG